jgi:OmpA-OmpF porin, OOP family
MRKIIILSILLAGWIGGSTYWYVCKIRNNCKKQLTNEIAIIDSENAIKKATTSENEKVNPADSTDQIARKLNLAENTLKAIGTKVFQFEFACGQTILSPEDQTYFETLVFYLRHKTDKKIHISGHSDNIGSLKKNIELSMERANYIKTALEKSGVLASQIETEAKADKENIASNDTKEGRDKNRRVELKIVNL